MMADLYAKAEVLPPSCRAPSLRVAATAFTSGSRCLEQVRGWVAARLAGTGHEDILADVLTVTNELATSALTHSRSGCDGGSFTVALIWDANAVRVVVTDQGGDGVPELRTTDLDSESGRGLLVTAGLADHWNWRVTVFGVEVAAEFRPGAETGAGSDEHGAEVADA